MHFSKWRHFCWGSPFFDTPNPNPYVVPHPAPPQKKRKKEETRKVSPRRTVPPKPPRRRGQPLLQLRPHVRPALPGVPEAVEPNHRGVVRSHRVLQKESSSIRGFFSIRILQACICGFSTSILWMAAKSISHHVETIGNQCFLVFTGEASPQGFLGGAKWISSVHRTKPIVQLSLRQGDGKILLAVHPSAKSLIHGFLMEHP